MLKLVVAALIGTVLASVYLLIGASFGSDGRMPAWAQRRTNGDKSARSVSTSE